ncbi:hypothetical protein EJD97_007194, partial [Solanum chilense]
MENPNNLSCDVLFSILVRIPVKSLLRFRCVSVSWNDIIFGREFKKDYIDQSKALGRGGCVYWYKVVDYNKNSAVIYFDMKSDEFKELPTPSFIRDSRKKYLFHLTISKDRLSLYRLKKKIGLELNMWIMEDDGWKLLMKIPEVLPKFYKYTKILCCL